MEKTEWIRCPVCVSKTRLQIREDTELKNFPLYCPKCRQESLIEAKNLQVTVIKEPDAQTQSRETSEQSQFVGSALYIPQAGQTYQIKKRSFGGLYCHARISDRYTSPNPVLSLEGCFYVLVGNGFTAAYQKQQLSTQYHSEMRITCQKNPCVCVALLYPKIRCQIST